ncbi:MAG TPA: MASE1 domain-containing protein [Patescibacteria group bacterium]|nr:MASE1 domain-containing protein [Patescibacteria group bacterium]
MSAQKEKTSVYLLKLAAVFMAYLVMGRIGLSFEAVNGFASLVWPPTGIAIAVTVLYGRRFWPAIAAAAFAVNFSVGAPVQVALGIALGNTLEALLASWLLLADGRFRHTLENPRSVVSFIGLAAGLSTLVSATIGTTSLWLGDVVHAQSYAATWRAWWIGDVFGALIVAPFLMIWLGRKVSLDRFAARSKEVLVMIAIFAVVAAFMYDSIDVSLITPQAASYIMMIPLVWAGVRFGMRGGTTAIFAFALISVYATALGRGPFAAVDLNDGIASLHLFLGASAVIALFLGSAHDERIRADEDRRELRNDAREHARYLKAIIDLAPVGIKLLDPSSRVLRINPAGLRLMGAESERDLQDRPILEMTEPDDRPAFGALLKRVFEGGSGGLRQAIKGLKGARHVFDVKMVPFSEDGKITAALAMFDDRTREVEQERLLKENYDEMEHLNKTLVGRELKMIELKKDLKEVRSGKGGA